MRIIVADTTEKYILKQYPHLSKEDIEMLFEKGELKGERQFDACGKGNEHLLQVNTHYKLILPEDIARIANVGCKIDLTIGQEHFIYKVCLD